MAITSYADYLHRQLEQKLPGILMRKMPGLPFANGQFLPATADLAIGAETLTRETMEAFGEAVIYSDTTSDLPTISTTIDERGYRAVTFVAGVKWTINELEKASFAGTDVVSRRTQFLPRFFDERKQKFILAGSPQHNITGFFNNAQVPKVNSTFNPNTASASDFMDFIYEILSETPDRTNLVGGIALMLVPLRFRQKMAQLFLSGTSVSVLEKVLEVYGPSTGGTLRQIVAINEMKSDVLELYGINPAGTDKDLIMLAPVDPTACRRMFNARRPLPLEGPIDTVYKQYYLESTSEPMFDYPLEFQYVTTTKMLDGIT
jgi:hypothetical protein